MPPTSLRFCGPPSDQAPGGLHYGVHDEGGVLGAAMAFGGTPRRASEWGDAIEPGLGCLKLARETEKQSFAARLGHELNPDRQAVIRP